MRWIEKKLGCKTDGPDLTALIVCAEGELSLDFEGGALVRVSRRPTSADLYIRYSGEGLLEALAGLTTVRAEGVEASIDGIQFAPMHPFDCGSQPPDHVPVIDVDLVVQHGQYLSPVGDIHFHDIFLNGLLAERRPGIARRPDAAVQNLYTNVIRSNTPEVPLTEAAAGAHVVARHTRILLSVAALYENPQLRAHLNQRREVSDRLCALAAHTRSQQWLADGPA